MPQCGEKREQSTGRVLFIGKGRMGFEKVILEDGQGLNVPPGATVTVHCTGYGKNGNLKEKFWSTKDPGQEPFTFKIGVGSVSLFWFLMK